jgi:hypothetical protein
MAKRFKVMALGALAIGYGSVHLLVQQRYADTVLERIRALEPQSAATVRSRPAGSVVLVEGRIGRSIPARQHNMVAYVRSSELRLSKNEAGPWIADDRVAPALPLEVAGGSLTIEPGYMLQEASSGWQTKRYHYSGFERGAMVFAVGTLTPQGTLRAETVYGGSRQRFLLRKTGETWAGYLADVFAIGLGLLMIGATVWLTRARPVVRAL